MKTDSNPRVISVRRWFLSRTAMRPALAGLLLMAGLCLPARAQVSFQNSSPITINANSSGSPYPSAISVAGLVGTIGKTTVTLNGFSHPQAASVDVLVVSPSGQKVLISGSSASLPSPAPAGPYATSLGAFSGDPNGNWQLFVSDTTGNAGLISGGWQLTLELNPTVSLIPSQVTLEDTPLAVLFTVGDQETPPGSLVVTATSANQALVSNANLGLGGTGTTRVLTNRPSANQFGTTTITVSVTDTSGHSTSSSFLLTVNSVNDAPFISAISAQNIFQNSSSPALPFAVSDVETAAGSLAVSAASSNPVLVPNNAANLQLGGSGSSRTLRIFPAPGQIGIATIMVTVTDGNGSSATRSFQVTVNPSLGWSPLLAPGWPIVGVAAVPGSAVNAVASPGIVFGANYYPPNASANKAIDGDPNSKYLNFAESNVGLIVTIPSATAASGLRLTTGNDRTDRDPLTITIEGTSSPDPATAAAGASWTLLYSGSSGLGTDPGRVSPGQIVWFPNTAAFNTYRVLVTSVRNPISAESTQFGEVQLFAFNSAQVVGGGLRREMFLGITGSDLASFTNHPKFSGPPDSITLLSSAEAPADVGDDYGQRLRGYVLPPVSGDYIFYVASDDESQVFLSTDAGAANKRLIATDPQWNGSRQWIGGVNPVPRGNPPVNMSVPIPLLAGQAYYFEVLHKEGGGGDHVEVTWQLPGAPAPVNGDAPIPGQYLAYDRSLAPALNTPPSISPIAAQNALANAPTADLPFTVLDAETAAGLLSVSASSSNPGLIPNLPANLTLGGSASYRTVRITPAPNRTGNAVITLTVTDGGGLSSSTTFNVSVGEPLFTDNFNVSGVGVDVNSEYNGGRQSGTAAPLLYRDEFGIGSSAPVLLNTALAPGQLQLTSKRLSPDHNFNEAGRFALDFDVNLDFLHDGAPDSSYWAGVAFGTTQPNAGIQNNGFGIVFRNNGGWEAYADGQFIADGWSLQAGVLPVGQFHLRFEVIAQDLAGSPATISMFISGVQMPLASGPNLSFTKNSGFGGNYITFSSDGGGDGPNRLHAFDNLAVTAYPVMQVSQLEPVLAVGSNPNALRVRIHPWMNQSQSVDVTLTSQNPAIAVPTGGSGGSLTLTFPAGGATEQWVAITGVAAGSAQFALSNTSGFSVDDPLNVTIYPTSSPVGFVRREVFRGIFTGNSIDDLLQSPRFPAQPDLISAIPALETPSNFDDNYGQRIQGFFLPPATGDYTFYISSDDVSALFVSTDESPANLRLIASEPGWNGYRQWTNGSNQGSRGNPPVNISAPVTLQAGLRYRFQVLHMEGGGGDNLAVAWRKPGDPVPADGSDPIPGQYLAYSPSIPPVSIAFADANLEAAVRATLNKPAGPITDLDMLRLTTLNLTGAPINNFSGLEYALRLNLPPMTAIQSKSLFVGEVIPAALFTPGDPARLGQISSVTATSSDQSFIPDANLSLADGGRFRSLTITVPPGVSGSATITLTVNYSSGLPSSVSSSFQVTVLPNSPGNFFIEAEDFNYGGGQHKPAADVMPYLGGAYAGLGAVNGIDYLQFTADPAGSDYRVGEDSEVAFYPSVDPGRGSYAMVSDYKIGWNGANEWFDYTRNFPVGYYHVYGRLASGGTDTHADLSLVTSGANSPTQTTVSLGKFDAPPTGGWDTFRFVPLKQENGDLTEILLNGEETVRFTILPGSLDFNYFLFIPIIEVPTIMSLSPGTVAAGSASFTLTVNGSFFLPGSTVRWNGASRSTTYISEAQLTAEISAADVVGGADITTALVSVLGPNNVLSNPKSFAITAANVAVVQTVAAAPGQTVTVTTAPSTPDAAGVTATISNNGENPVSLTVANYSADPAGTAFNAGGGFTDVQITGVDVADTAAVNFYYPSTIDPATEAALTLMTFNGTAWVPVRSTGDSDPVKDTTDNLDGTVSGGRFTVVFSATSSPKITELGGTFFAMGTQPTVTFTGFLPPIGGGDQTGGTQGAPVRTFKAGSTIPVKFTASAGGVPVLTGVQTLQVQKYSSATVAGVAIDATPQGNATSGNQFRLTGDQWQFNLDTKTTGMTPGVWKIMAKLSDGSIHFVWIQLK